MSSEMKSDAQGVLLHILPRLDWAQAQQMGHYEARSLRSEGFIHFSKPHQVLRVANFLFREQKDLLLLEVREDLVTSPIKYEGADGDIFPHVYGPLNLDAVVAVHEFPWNNGFQLPGI